MGQTLVSYTFARNDPIVHDDPPGQHYSIIDDEKKQSHDDPLDEAMDDAGKIMDDQKPTKKQDDENRPLIPYVMRDSHYNRLDTDEYGSRLYDTNPKTGKPQYKIIRGLIEFRERLGWPLIITLVSGLVALAAIIAGSIVAVTNYSKRMKRKHEKGEKENMENMENIVNPLIDRENSKVENCDTVNNKRYMYLPSAPTTNQSYDIRGENTFTELDRIVFNNGIQLKGNYLNQRMTPCLD